MRKKIIAALESCKKYLGESISHPDGQEGDIYLITHRRRNVASGVHLRGDGRFQTGLVKYDSGRVSWLPDEEILTAQEAISELKAHSFYFSVEIIITGVRKC